MSQCSNLTAKLILWQFSNTSICSSAERGIGRVRHQIPFTTKHGEKTCLKPRPCIMSPKISPCISCNSANKANNFFNFLHFLTSEHRMYIQWNNQADCKHNQIFSYHLGQEWQMIFSWQDAYAALPKKKKTSVKPIKTQQNVLRWKGHLES